MAGEAMKWLYCRRCRRLFRNCSKDLSGHTGCGKDIVAATRFGFIDLFRYPELIVDWYKELRANADQQPY